MEQNWNVTPTEARAIQDELRKRVRVRPLRGRVKYVAGADLSFAESLAICAMPVLAYPSLEIIEVGRAELPVGFPYVPGLLSFRECPAMIAAYRSLTVRPDLLMVDGQGIAHPKRLGLAAHIGVLLDVPTIGCAKSRLIGTAEEPADRAGSYTEFTDGDEIIGAVLRTRDRVRPLYISPGHRIDLPGSLDWVLNCCVGFRLPEPTRIAHQWAEKLKREVRDS